MNHHRCVPGSLFTGAGLIAALIDDVPWQANWRSCVFAITTSVIFSPITSSSGDT